MKTNLLRMLALILTFCLVTLPTSYAQDEAYVPQCTYELDVLNAIGVLNESYSNEELAGLVTRAQMAHFVARIWNLQGGARFDDRYIDVDEETTYADDICITSELGIFNGYADKTFRPDDNILFQDAVKALLSSVGYTVLAEAAGGYFGGYLKYAGTSGLLDNLDNQAMNEPFPLASAIILMYNMLDVDIVTDVSYGTDENLKIKRGETVLTNLMKIQKAEGIVTANSKCSLTSAEGTLNGEIKIDETIFKIGQSGADKYLGYSIEFYYKTGDKADEMEILYAAPSSNSKTLVIEAESIVDYSNGTLQYSDDNDKICEIRLSTTADVIYNNQPVSVLSDDDILIKNGKLTLISNDGNSSYDVIISEEFRNISVQYIDYHSGTIIDKYDPKNPIVIDKNEINDTVFVYDRKGYESDLGILETDSLLSCLISRNGKFMVCYEIVDEIIGKVESISSTGDDKYITIDGVEYELANELKASGRNWEVGEKLICYLDINGRLASVIEGGSSRYRWSYLKDVGETSGLDSVIQIKLFDQDSAQGVFTVKICADTMYINGQKYTGKSAISTALNSMSDSIIQYALNGQGLVNRIETADGDSFSLIHEESTALLYDQGVQLMGGKVSLSESTGVFGIPDDGQEKNFKYGKPYDFMEHDSNYRVNAYRRTGDRINADILTIKYGGSTSSITRHSPVVLVKDVSMVINSEGEEVKKITALSGSREVILMSEALDTLDKVPALGDSETNRIFSIKKGDLIAYAANTDGTVRDALLIYRGSEDKIYSENPLGSFYTQMRVLHGYVYQRDGSTMLLSIKKDMSNVNEQAELEVHKITSSCAIYVYYKDKGVMTSGSTNDFIDYKKSGDMCSKVLSYTTGGVPKAIVIIR